MNVRRWLLLLALPIAALGLGAHAVGSASGKQIDRCLDSGGAWNYRTDECGAAPAVVVDRIYIDKSDHWLAAYSNGRIVREFRVALGRGGLAPKQVQGDGRVPEGVYRIVGHNPNSAFFLSLKIGYPTDAQAISAAATGANPGGDIMIHGLPNGRGWVGSNHRRFDWTEGCIALTNPEIKWLYSAVPDGTLVEIRQ
jgi:murein L,D-transpeptidase YafK